MLLYDRFIAQTSSHYWYLYRPCLVFTSDNLFWEGGTRKLCFTSENNFLVPPKNKLSDINNIYLYQWAEVWPINQNIFLLYGTWFVQYHRPQTTELMLNEGLESKGSNSIEELFLALFEAELYMFHCLLSSSGIVRLQKHNLEL